MIVKENGLYHLDPKEKANSGASIVYVSGSFGTASVVISYRDELGNVVPFTDGVVTEADQYKIEHGFGVALLLNVTGVTTGTNLAVTTARI